MVFSEAHFRDSFYGYRIKFEFIFNAEKYFDGKPKGDFSLYKDFEFDEETSYEISKSIRESFNLYISEHFPSNDGKYNLGFCMVQTCYRRWKYESVPVYGCRLIWGYKLKGPKQAIITEDGEEYKVKMRFPANSREIILDFLADYRLKQFKKDKDEQDKVKDKGEDEGDEKNEDDEDEEQEQEKVEGFGLGQDIYKCSPGTGALDTYSFSVGTTNGVACVKRSRRSSDKGTILMYIDKLTASGERKIAVATSKFDSLQGKFIGTMYRLYPPGPKKPFTMITSAGFLSIDFENGSGSSSSIIMTLKPNGIAWVPADIRLLNGCAMETPQLYMDVMDQTTMQHSKMMLCAMSSKLGEGYDSMYGFGMRMSQTIGMESFFFLGKSKTPIYPTGPLNIKAKLMDVCLRSDSKLCCSGFTKLTLSN